MEVEGRGKAKENEWVGMMGRMETGGRGEGGFVQLTFSGRRWKM